MRALRVLLVLLVAVVGTAAGAAAPTAAGAATPTPVLVGVRAAHHPTFDRVVFDFAGGLPSSRRATWVTGVRADPSGLPSPRWPGGLSSPCASSTPRRTTRQDVSAPPCARPGRCRTS